MKVEVRVEQIAMRIVLVDAGTAVSETLPKLVHLEGWRSDGQFPERVPNEQKREGGQPCNP